jgi:hypothetical protein
MPLVAAKKSRVKSIVISNFSWYDVLKFISSDTKEILKKTYSDADLCIKLPLGTPMKHFKKKIDVGLVKRDNIKKMAEIRNYLGIKNSEYVVLISLGGSKNISFTKSDNVKIFTMNTKLSKKLLAFDISNYVEGQEIVSIADLVICKCGYGFISECLSSGTPFFYIADKSHLEQKAISHILKEMNKGFQINHKELEKLFISNKFLEQLPKFKKEKNSIRQVVNEILKMI